MAAEFQRYCHQALHDVPSVVAGNVERALATSLSDYPALGPEFQLSRVTGATGSLVKQRGGALPEEADEPLQALAITASSPPAYPKVPNQPSPPPPGAVFRAAVDPAGSGDPHEREKEFQGLFTPFFLPLLDSSPSLPLPPLLPHSGASLSLAEPVITGTGIGSGRGVHVGAADQLQGSPQHLQGRDMEGSCETRARQGTSQAASPIPSRPDPTRRSTDDTTTSSCALSDKSDTAKVPRSALRRRSSSSSKPPHTSPRRVRFQFRGTEVLPTASPQPSDFPTPCPSSPVASDQTRTFDEIVGNNGDKEDVPPEEALPPRKISSSEALRALSRAPLDEGTVWTVVNPGPEEANRSKDSSAISTTMSSKTETATSGPIPTSPGGSEIRQIPIRQNIPQPQRPLQEEDSDESSEDEFLSLAKPKSFKNKMSIQPTTDPRSPDKTSPSEKPASEVAPRREEDDKDQPSSDDFDEEDNVFHFETETGGLSAPPKPKRKPPPPKEDIIELPEPDVEIGQASQAAASPAVPISKPPVSPGSSTPTTSKFHIGSLGSYKGRPVIMPVVKDPDVHARAASLGEFNTFVGGLDGRSGVDEGDLSSFRASLVQSGFSGTPRSLTERMMMEDAQAERRNGG